MRKKPTQEQTPVVSTPRSNHLPTASEKSNCQLNAWITGGQNKLLDQLYFRLRANGVKIKKGELIGVAIEVLSRILEKQTSATLDNTVLDTYIQDVVHRK
jgi:hypothetical protein